MKTFLANFTIYYFVRYVFNGFFILLQPPVEPRPWFQVRNVTKWPSACLQQTKSKEVFGDEDCLYLNVFVPSVSCSILHFSFFRDKENRPIKLFIFIF